MFMNGAQGGMVTADNRNLDDLRDPARAVWNDDRVWSECVRIGHLLADESLRILSNANTQADPSLVCRSKMVRFPVESDEVWAVVRYSPLKYPHNADRTISTRINAINIGNSQILTIPGEALPNVGFYLKRKMQGQNNMLFGLTNDAFGYIMTKVDFNSFERYEYISRVSLGENTGEILSRAREAGLLLTGQKRNSPFVAIQPVTHFYYRQRARFAPLLGHYYRLLDWIS